MEIVSIQQWTFTFSRMESKMSRVEIKFSILGLPVITQMEFCFPKVGKIYMFPDPLFRKLKSPFNWLQKFKNKM